jgi:hypothetical protein
MNANTAKSVREMKDPTFPAWIIWFAVIASLVGIALMVLEAKTAQAETVSWAEAYHYIPVTYHREQRVERVCASPFYAVGRVQESHFSKTGVRFAGCPKTVVAMPVSESEGGEIVTDTTDVIIIDDGGKTLPNIVDDTTVDTHTDNGNHYGNDKLDNNQKDVKNKHNGEQTAADHHDHNGQNK